MHGHQLIGNALASRERNSKTRTKLELYARPEPLWCEVDWYRAENWVFRTTLYQLGSNNHLPLRISCREWGSLAVSHLQPIAWAVAQGAEWNPNPQTSSVRWSLANKTITSQSERRPCKKRPIVLGRPYWRLIPRSFTIMPLTTNQHYS